MGSFKKSPAISSREAQIIIAKERQAKILAAKAGIEKVLADSDCVLEPSFVITVRGIIPKIDIVPKNNKD
jgi:hypothetical protein